MEKSDGKLIEMNWKTFTIALKNSYNCIGKLLQLHWKNFTIALKTYKNRSRNLKICMKNPVNLEFKNSVKAALLSYCNYIRKLKKCNH